MDRSVEIVVVDRFTPLRKQLLELLRGLDKDEWDRATVARGWSVKDVAAHLLGGDIGILSRERDQFRSPTAAPEAYADLVDLVNDQNREFVQTARRFSPRLLCDLLELLGVQVEEYFSSLDSEGIGGPVSWAGPDP